MQYSSRSGHTNETWLAARALACAPHPRRRGQARGQGGGWLPRDSSRAVPRRRNTCLPPHVDGPRGVRLRACWPAFACSLRRTTTLSSPRPLLRGPSHTIVATEPRRPFPQLGAGSLTAISAAAQPTPVSARWSGRLAPCSRTAEIFRERQPPSLSDPTPDSPGPG